ncbi:MAG TPA: FKBP-type peptidyl-prolyl cis-trans isomerase [Saprospiraceae bacterium]|nr:FKBP-type peptidyl-prolyl cis-trans isomerase [Saprospiraceae bacterium]
MKKVLIILIMGLMFVGMSCSSTKKTAATKAETTTTPGKEELSHPKPMTPREKASYALGVSIYNNLKGQALGDIDINLLAEAMMDVKKGKELKIPLADANAAITEYQKAQTAAAKEKAEAEAKKFLTENAKKPGVKTTASGLQYEVLTPGTGKKPSASDKVTVHYKGMLLDGKVFDSSYKRGQPTTFGLGQVIKGWTEGLQLMKEGAKYRFVIPSELAYGARGAGADIPPYSTLIFEVELLKVGDEDSNK